MRGDRLLSILLMLQDSGLITAKVLAERLEVSERTIHRDMEALSSAGIPVMADRGSVGGWRLMEGYKTDLTGLTREELQALLLAASVRLPTDTDLRVKLESALIKLVTAAPSEHLSDVRRIRERLHIDGIGWNNHHEPTPWLSLIQEAVWNDHRIEFSYNKGDQTVVRIAEPLGIVAKGKVWYMIATVDTETRTYRISRITEARLTGDHYDRPVDFDLAAWWQASTAAFYEQLPRFHALLRMEEDQLAKLKRIRYVNVQAVRDTPSLRVEDVSPEHLLEVEVVFDSIEVACEVLFSFASTVEALEPAILRETMLERAQLLVARYQA
ncbi:helix-turn-helix transcriptional regulator [Paenibacillus mendelii]|uniref:Helix-turn-helix transcriptional regulator n=1 Tax=Paenibacillus mendelii TaxID=206163 RepID=A0ABV6J9Z1_9BACL|nr:WYL domain-containing protein [Paenibacillus mendelii]MCQ6560891.1 WYL domain-containing protein [Paenibacillus mendelii]